MYKELLDKLQNKEVVIINIGTDRAVFDSLTPMVGSMLEKYGIENVYGTLHNPIHFLNLKEKLEYIYSRHGEDVVYIAIDACVSDNSNAFTYKLSNEPLTPGKGVNKNGCKVGDYSIFGLIGSDINNVRLSQVIDLATEITHQLLAFYEEKRDIRYLNMRMI